MDFLKTLLVYMVMLMSAATDASVTTPPSPPAALPTAYVTTAPTRVPTLAPTLTPSPTPIVYTTLYVGDRGDQVKKLQRRLAELGYLNDTIDGIFGQKTKRAVERFQYYNGLNSDGVAGQSTQRALFESVNVIYAPPDITAAPTPTATPYTPVPVYVPVYYVDKSGALLARTGTTLTASSMVYADSRYVPAGYILTSSPSVYVYTSKGYATPSSVTFTYDKQATASPTLPAPVYIPVYYMTEDNRVLYLTTQSLTRGGTATVYAQNGLVPSDYRLVSASSVTVYVNNEGTASPASVIFRYRPVSATSVPTITPPAMIAYNVYYLTDFDEWLYTDTVYLTRGSLSTVYANNAYVGSGYELISQPSVQVFVSSNGDAQPTQINFRYRAVTVTATPSQTPEVTATPSQTPEVTEAPSATPEVTEAPSATPEVTETPTATPEATETPSPTPEVTEAPSATPEATETPSPTPEATETPSATPEVTEAPTPTPPTDTLRAAGTTVVWNNQNYAVQWYLDNDDKPYLGLRDLTAIVRALSDMSGGVETVLYNGHTIAVTWVGGSIGSLTLDGSDCTSLALAKNGEAYLSLTLIGRLGITANANGDTLTLEQN